MILFSRLIAIVQREEDVTQYFKYELTAFPTFLFKEAGMRKTQKSQLAKAITTGVEPADCSVSAIYLINGGALLHKTQWAKKPTYKYIVKQYVSYVRANYGQDCCIVFDGYKNGPLTKDQEHLRRSGKASASIKLSETMQAHITQQTFLNNEEKKMSVYSFIEPLP